MGWPTALPSDINGFEGFVKGVLHVRVGVLAQVEGVEVRRRVRGEKNDATVTAVEAYLSNRAHLTSHPKSQSSAGERARGGREERGGRQRQPSSASRAERRRHPSPVRT